MPQIFELRDLYNHFEIGVIGLEACMSAPRLPQAITIIENCNVFSSFSLCVFFDEPSLKHVEAHCNVESISVSVSPSICIALSELPRAFSENHESNSVDIHDYGPCAFRYFMLLSLKHFTLLFNLENDNEDDAVVSFTFEDIYSRFNVQEFLDLAFCLKTITIESFTSKTTDRHVLCSSTCNFPSKPSDLIFRDLDFNSPWSTYEKGYSDGCLLFHYQSRHGYFPLIYEYDLMLNDIDLHVHPKIFVLMNQCLTEISEQFASPECSMSETCRHEKYANGRLTDLIDIQNFGFSNFRDADSILSSITLNCFPFVTVENTDVLCSTESTFSLNIHSWQNLQVKDEWDLQSQNVYFWRKLRNLKSSALLDNANLPVPCSFVVANKHVLAIDIWLNKIKVHFHDSSCTLGTISLPTCELLFSSCGSYWDLLCSARCLTLSTSGSSSSTQVLLGPALANVCPIVNIRARSEMTKGNHPTCEISIGIQHVNCTLPPEFLAIIIDYCMLPDWSPLKNGTHDKERDRKAKSTSHCTAFKLEILGSTLRFPLGCCSDYYSCFGLELLYCCFVSGFNSINDSDLHIECRIKPPASGDLSMFGHNISLFVHSIKSEKQTIGFVEVPFPRDICLMEKLNADVLIRIPGNRDFCAEQSSCLFLVSVTANSCHFLIGDHCFSALEAIIKAVYHYASVGTELESDQYEEFQLTQSKRMLKVTAANPCIEKVTKTCIIEVTANKLCIILNQVGLPNTSSEVIAESEVCFSLDMAYVNDELRTAKIAISRLFLHSSVNSLLLSSSEDAAAVCCSLLSSITSSDQWKVELFIYFPFLDIWLYLFDWHRIIYCFYTYIKQPAGPSGLTSGCDAPQTGCHFCNKSKHSFPSNLLDPNKIWLKLENTRISFHLPLVDRNYLPEKFNNSGPIEGKKSKFLKISVESRDAELTFSKADVKLESYFEVVRGMLEVSDDDGANSVPFLLISQVGLKAEFLEIEHPIMNCRSEVCVESVEVRLSHEIFKFWHSTQVPESESAPGIPFSLDFKVILNRGSILLNDEKWSCAGPVFELITKHAFVKAKTNCFHSEACLTCEISVNYKNFQKMMWEAFVEPWRFELKLVRENENIISSPHGTSDIHLRSSDLLNFNATEPLIEAISRVAWMINDVREGLKLNRTPRNPAFHGCGDLHMKSAPYVLQNDTSLPLLFWVSSAYAQETNLKSGSLVEGSLQPGFSIPIFVEDAITEDNSFQKISNGSGNFLERRECGAPHHMISIQLEGASNPSKPMSMDLVGIIFYESNFSDYEVSDSTEIGKLHAIKSGNTDAEATILDGPSGSVTVVFEVSMDDYGKLLRLHSKVILLNATSKPLELRFDIPFGISQKILGPVPAGQQFPLPVHLAESGRIRWRPVGPDYLWSDAYSLSSMLTNDQKIGNSRLCVCYPTNHSSDPFRFCLSVEDYNLGSTAGQPGHCEVPSPQILRGGTDHIDNVVNNQVKTSRQTIHQIKLVTPILIKNCLPTVFSLEIDSTGMMRSALLPENGMLPLYHTDSAHDLVITFHMQGFRPATTKFPRADIFLEISKAKDSSFSISEILAFYPDTSSGAVFISLEKTVDACSGAREICLFVPFLLYNCTGIPFAIIDSDLDGKGNFFVIPSSYNLVEQNQLFPEEDGLSLLLPDSKKCSIRKNADIHNHLFSRRHFSSDLPQHYPSTTGNDGCAKKIFPCKSAGISIAAGFRLTGAYNTESDDVSEERNYSGVKPCIYSPSRHLSSTDLLVRLQAYFPHLWAETKMSSTDSWSAPFSLTPASGSTSIVIPQPTTFGAFLASVTSSPLSGDLRGRTKVVVFQPRYVIYNTCSKELCYKQKGTDFFYRLGAGQYFHLHWADRTRELLISIRFNELGWQWSGSFLPDCLGDTMVKMRNYVTGETCRVLVEVQNADTAGHDVNIAMTTGGASGTYVVLLSDDSTGDFMPYRIDNYSMEMIRVYQQKCEMFETTVHSYTSCQYAWDEPTFPHRLTIEVPGERILGTYNFDEVGEYADVCLPQTLEKPERRIFIAVHAEGAIKVLTIIDSRYHNIDDIKENNFFRFGERKISYKGPHSDYSERIRIQLSIGFSLIDSNQEELIYAQAEDVTITWLQNVHQQKIFFQIFSMQIDNQIRSTQYPVIVSFNPDSVKNSPDQSNENNMRTQNEDVCMVGGLREPALHISVAKWRKKEASLISFECMNIRLSPLHLEIEERVLFRLLDFLKIVSSKFNGGAAIVDYGIGAADYHAGAVNSGSNVYHFNFKNFPLGHHPSLPTVIPIGAPSQIFSSFRKHRKIYIEAFAISALNITLSFSSNPWMRLKNNVEPVSLLHFSSMKFQRSLMALVDVEGVQFHLGKLTLTNLMGSWYSIQDILTRHYSRQLLRESYKVFGSAGVIGNPMGFARNVGTGVKDLLSVSTKDLVQRPSEVITGMAQGSKSLFSNMIYAVSSATTQFSKAAHKGIVAFALDDQTAANMENHNGLDSRGGGLLDEFFQGLTGFLQSPIRGAEKHGLPGVLSGVAMGTAGLVARPVASILEATGRTAQIIRNRSNPNQLKRYRIRLPRPVARDLPLLPYSWEDAIGSSVLLDGGDPRMRNETFILCKSLKQPGKFVVITKRLVLVVSSANLVGLGSPEFSGVADPDWVVEMEMPLENVFHVDRCEEVVNVVGHPGSPVRRKTSNRRGRGQQSSFLVHTSVELSREEEAEEVTRILLHTIEKGESQKWGRQHILHRIRKLKNLDRNPFESVLHHIDR